MSTVRRVAEGQAGVLCLQHSTWRPALKCCPPTAGCVLPPPPLRCSAYKLGKRRWSYNQVELLLCEAGDGGRVVGVKQAVNMGTDNFKEEVRVRVARGAQGVQ